jgi:putative endonuclease
LQITQKNFYKKFLGRAGENRAVNYLKENGYKIAEKNFKTRIGEIDVIAEKDGIIIFIEVKTRSSNAFGEPSEAVNYVKQSKYVKVASEYLIRKGLVDSPCRFDVIEIIDGKINHIDNAFYA